MAGRREGSRWAVGLQVAQFAVAGAIALAIVAVATSIASRRVGQREAIADARLTTLTRAKGVVEPSLTDALLGGDPSTVAVLDQIVRRDVLDRSLVRVKVWRRDGTILFSDEPRLIGERYELGEDEVSALDTGRIEADISDLKEPENRYEQSFRQLLEVYLPIDLPGGQPVLFEAYYRYDVVRSNGTRLWRSFAPIALGALLALEVVQIPLAASLARRLSQRQREREALLRRAIDASEVERRRIAADLHDGVVQDLAGVAFSLSAAARAPSSVDAAGLEQAATTVRASLSALRSLVVDIAPPDLDRVGLVPALTELVTAASARGLPARLEAEALVDPVGGDAARLVHRAAAEALRNAEKHASASAVVVRVATAADAVALTVTDDGDGFDPSAPAPEGHVGLVALRGVLADGGARLVVRSSVGAGTTVSVEVPNR